MVESFLQTASPARTRAKLAARLIRMGYELTRDDVRIGDHLIVPFTRVRDADAVLDRVVIESDRREKIRGAKESDDELHLPYWAELWDSAIGVATHLALQRAALKTALLGVPRSALDLGCGMGFTGTVAAMLGYRVLFADIETAPLIFAMLNAIPYARRILVRRPELRKRSFGQRRYADSIRARRVDWRRDRLGETFDLIIGADVLYERSQWEFLEPFWRAHLSAARDACVLLGEPGRVTGEMFLPWIEARGWNVSISEVRIARRATPIRLFRIMPNARHPA